MCLLKYNVEELVIVGEQWCLSQSYFIASTIPNLAKVNCVPSLDRLG